MIVPELRPSAVRRRHRSTLYDLMVIAEYLDAPFGE